MPESILNPLEAAAMPTGCGCDLTKTSFQDRTPSVIEGWSNTVIGSQKLLQNLMRARQVGVRWTTRMAFMTGTIQDLKEPVMQRPITGAREMVNLPYVYRRREANISHEYFKLVDGSGSSVGAGGLWQVDVTVINDDLYDAPSGVPIYKQFIPRQYIYVNYKDSGANPGSQNTYQVPFEIVQSDEIAGTPDRARLRIRPSFTTAGWNALNAAEQAELQPQEGVVQIGVNNVDDFEQNCLPEPVFTAPSLKVDYFQTTRQTFCWEKEALELIDRIENGDINEFWKMFKHLPVHEHNRRANQSQLEKWYRSIYSNGPLNELQSPEGYTGVVDPSLTVYDPSDDTCALGYKANALGMRELLKAEGQVLDFKGGALNLDILFQKCYALKRNRELEGDVVTSIGAVTSRKVYDRAATQILNYIRKRYGDQNINRYYTNGEVISHATGIQMRYMKFDLPEYEFTFVLAADNFFTDREAAMERAGQGSHSGTIELVDWTDFHISIVATNSEKLTEKDEIAAKVDADLKCTMARNTKYLTLESVTWTNQFGNEKRSLIVEGFNPEYCFELKSEDCIDAPDVS